MNSNEYITIFDKFFYHNLYICRGTHYFLQYLGRFLGWLASPISINMSTRGNYMSRDLWISTKRLSVLTQKILDQWEDMQLDVIIAPGET